MNQKFNTVELTKMALLTALICVSAYIVIPLPFTPASLTAQTLVVNLIALLLTPRQAAFTMVVYILLGLTACILRRHGRSRKTVWPNRRLYHVMDSSCHPHVMVKGNILQL